MTELQKQARSYRAKGYASQRQDNLAVALTYYQKALLLDPSYVVAYNDVGIIFEAEGRKEEAKEMYLKAIKTDPAYPNSYSNLALLYEESGDYDNAILYWLKRKNLRHRKDAWFKAAKKRLGELALLYPEIYTKVTGEKAGPTSIRKVKKTPQDKKPTEANRGFLVKKAIAVKPPAVKPVLAKPQEPRKEKPKKQVKTKAKAIKKTPLRPKEPSVTQAKKVPEGKEAQEGNRGFFIKNSKPTVLHKAILK